MARDDNRIDGAGRVPPPPSVTGGPQTADRVDVIVPRQIERDHRKDIFDRMHDASEEVTNIRNRLGEWFSDPRLTKDGAFPGPMPNGALDPRVLARSMIRIGNAMGASGLAAFAFEQALLWGLNSEGARVYDPLSLPVSPIRPVPIITNIKPIAYDPTDIRLNVNQTPGLHEKAALEREGKSIHKHHSDFISNHERFNKRLLIEPGKIPKLEAGIGMTGPQNVYNSSRPRTVGADSQDDSLVSFNKIIDPSEMIDKRDGHHRSILELALDTRNLYDENNDRGTSGPVVMMHEIVDPIIDEGKSDFVIEDDRAGMGGRSRFNIAALFDTSNKKLGPVPQQNMRPSQRTKYFGNGGDHLLRISSFAHGIIPMSFQGERPDSSFITRDMDELVNEQVSDDEAYVPLSFTDLRPIKNQSDGTLRTVYFRPIITSLTEDFSPEWNKETYYGRSDQVVHYVSTIRNIFLSFELHAFGPEDVKVIHNKLNWLRSLVYPEYGPDGLLRSGPVCRIRVGDYIAHSNKKQLGLPGVIDSLNFDATDSIWELKKELKVPRTVKVSVSFHVIHDDTMGRNENGVFGAVKIFTTEGSVSSGPDVKNRVTNEKIDISDVMTEYQSNIIINGIRPHSQKKKKKKLNSSWIPKFPGKK